MKPVLVSLLVFSLTQAAPTTPATLLFTRDVSNCPLYLPKDNYEYPHLIVPISSASPNAAMGNTYNPTVSPNDIATIFNFDVPAARAHQHCTLFFSLPSQSQLVTSSYSFNGAGNLEFAMYAPNTGATASTTWSSQPPLSGFSITLPGIAPGTSHSVWNGDCGGGGLMSWRVKSADTCLWYFQDWNECAIGAFLVYSSDGGYA